MYLQVFFLVLTLSSFSSVSAQPYHAFVAPILKHTSTSTSLYSITLNFQELYIIDVDAPFTWFVCSLSHRLVGCSTPQCIAARTYLSPGCSPANNTLKNGQCYCNNTPVSPVTGACSVSPLTNNDLIIYWTDGHNPTVGINFNQLFVSCAPASLLNNLSKKIIGVASLAWTPLALPYLFTYPLEQVVARKFSICLPSLDTARGAIFFGNGPYHIQAPTNFDAASTLSYTPLIKHPNSPGYYITVAGILIDGRSVHIPQSAFEVDPSGHGGVKLSTVVPYTTLRGDIYRAFVRGFRRASRGIPPGKSVKPFSFCLRTGAKGRHGLGFHVPRIDLQLEGGTSWSINGSNSMVQVGDELACLAFLDGGNAMEQAIVIGSYQMENNFLQFDLAESRFGFSSSLSDFGANCGGFNFTITGWPKFGA